MKRYGNYSIQDIISRIDHTNLKQTATWDDIRALCDQGIKYGVASVCIPSCFVKRAFDYVGGKLKICTVIGFPNGYSTKEAKCFEAAEAVKNGADEIDMVINIGALKEKKHKEILDEIDSVKNACSGKLLKVIVETCLLTEEEKIVICEIVSQSQAEFIKTSTGFSKYGATKEDVELLKKNCTGKKVKAAGGIKCIEDAVLFMDLGADRLGTSSLLDMIINDCGGSL